MGGGIPTGAPVGKPVEKKKTTKQRVISKYGPTIEFGNSMDVRTGIQEYVKTLISKSTMYGLAVLVGIFFVMSIAEGASDFSWQVPFCCGSIVMLMFLMIGTALIPLAAWGVKKYNNNYGLKIRRDQVVISTKPYSKEYVNVIPIKNIHTIEKYEFSNLLPAEKIRYWVLSISAIPRFLCSESAKKSNIYQVNLINMQEFQTNSAPKNTAAAVFAVLLKKYPKIEQTVETNKLFIDIPDINLFKAEIEKRR